MYRSERHNDIGVLVGEIELEQLGVSFLARSYWSHDAHRFGRVMSIFSIGSAKRDGVSDAPPIPKQAVYSGYLIVVLSLGIASIVRTSTR